MTQFELADPLTITHLGAAAVVLDATSVFHLVLYADNANNPGALLASVVDTTLVTGENELPLDNPVQITAGLLWVGLCNDSSYETAYMPQDNRAGLVLMDEDSTVPDPFGAEGMDFPHVPIAWLVGY